MNSEDVGSTTKTEITPDGRRISLQLQGPPASSSSVALLQLDQNNRVLREKSILRNLSEGLDVLTPPDGNS